MHNISNGTQTNALPVPGAVVGAPGYWTNGVPGISPATIIDADWLNAIQEELAAVVTGAGIALDKGNNGQLLAALQSMFAGESGLAAEIAAREAGDATLNGNIGTETQQREAEDAVLNGNIGTETQQREAADAVLTEAVQTEAAARSNEDSQILGSLTSFVEAFQLATGAAGWFKAANGWILQWGTGVSNGELNINFPTSFPNAAAVVLAGEGDAAGWLVNGTVNPTVHAPTNLTSSGCTLVSAVIDAGGATALATGAALYYVAIGF